MSKNSSQSGSTGRRGDQWEWKGLNTFTMTLDRKEELSESSFCGALSLREASCSHHRGVMAEHSPFLYCIYLCDHVTLPAPSLIQVLWRVGRGTGHHVFIYLYCDFVPSRHRGEKLAL